DASWLHADDDRHRRVVDDAGAAHAPVHVVALRRVVDRPIAFVAIAVALLAERLAAAVVVGDDVVLAVGRIAAGADPRDRRHLGAGRAGVRVAAAAGGDEAVERAVAPVFARRVIALRRRRIGLAGLRHRGAGDRQQWHRADAEQRRAERGEETASRRETRQLARPLLEERVEAALHVRAPAR